MHLWTKLSKTSHTLSSTEKFSDLVMGMVYIYTTAAVKSGCDGYVVGDVPPFIC